MKVWLLFSCIVGILVLSTLSPERVPASQAAVTETTELPAVHIENPPAVSAVAYAVVDVSTGQIIYSHNAKAVLPIASVTKLFTAAAALKTTQLDEPVKVTTADVASEGRAGKLSAGQTFTLRELLYPLLLESSNDAAAVFERLLPVDIFAGVSLADASGLSAQNTATAEGLAYAVSDLYQRQEYLFAITTLPQYISTDTGWVNNSPVRDLPGYRGGKHGYTVAANRTLVALFTEPAWQSRTLGYIILGSDDLRADTEVLRAAIADSVPAK